MASDALAVAVDGGNPAIFYHAKRKGWHFLERKKSMVAIRATASRPLTILSDCVARGQRILSFVMNTFWWSESYPELTQHLSKTRNASRGDFRIQNLYLVRSNKVTMYHASEIQRFLQPSSRSCETTARQATSRSLPRASEVSRMGSE